MASDAQSLSAGWLKFLNPPTLRENLIRASLFLTAWETLKSAVVDHVKGFFAVGWDDAGEHASPEYQAKVLSLDKSPLTASLLWFKQMGAITDTDIALVDRLRQHRNELAHDLPKFLATVEYEVNVNLLRELVALVAKVDRWWIREIEMPISGDYTAEQVAAIPDSEITSGRMMLMQMLLQVATGNDPDASQWHNTLVKICGTPEQHNGK